VAVAMKIVMLLKLQAVQQPLFSPIRLESAG
jgi:hypothetical protein